jgi:hypothetical protein
VLRELSVVEQRYQAVLAVLEDGLSVMDVPVSRRRTCGWDAQQILGPIEVMRAAATILELRARGGAVEVAELEEDFDAPAAEGLDGRSRIILFTQMGVLTLLRRSLRTLRTAADRPSPSSTPRS